MKKIYLILFIIIGVHLLLLNNITFFPNSELFVYPYLTNKGLIPYQDIWDQHTPGLLFFPINFDNLGMNTPLEALRWHLAVVGVNQLLIFYLAKKLFKSNRVALLSCIFYAVFQPLYEGYIQWLDVFLPLFILPSLVFYYKYLEKEKYRNLIISGLFTGLGIVFKQVLIPFGLILGLLLLFRKNIKEIFFYEMGVIVPVSLMLLYLFKINALDDFWYWAVIYNLTVFAKSGTKAIPTISHLIRFISIYGLTVLFLVKNIRDKKILILGLGFAASMATVAARFDFVHLQASLPLAVILIAFGLNKEKNSIIKIGISGFLIIFTTGWLALFYMKHIGQGVLYFDENIYRVASRVNQLTSDNEEIFLYGSATHLYQMTNTLPAGHVFVFQFPWFMQVAEKPILEKLISSSPNVVVQNRSVTMQGVSITSYAPKLDKYISENYIVIEKVGNDEIMVRK